MNVIEKADAFAEVKAKVLHLLWFLLSLREREVFALITGTKTQQ